MGLAGKSGEKIIGGRKEPVQEYDAKASYTQNSLPIPV